MTDIEKKLETLRASLREFSEARERTGMQPTLHPALRQAVWDAVAERSARSFRVQAADLWKSQREFRRTLKAFTHGATAGQRGYWRALWARGLWQEFPQDYFVQLSTDGTHFDVDYVSVVNNPSSLVQTAQLNVKAERSSEQGQYSAEVLTIAVSEVFSTQAYRIYQQDLVDYLTLQLQLLVEEAIAGACAFTAGAGAVTFNSAAYAGTVYQAISADVIHLLIKQEAEEVVYVSPRVTVQPDLLFVHQSYYNRAELLKDLQARRLFASIDELVPEGVTVIPVPSASWNQQAAVVARSQAFGVAYRDELVVRVNPVSDFAEERNALRITVEYDVALPFVPRPGTPLRAHSRVAILNTDASVINTTNYNNQ